MGRDWGRLKRRKVEIAFVNEKQNVHICGGNHTIILDSKSIPTTTSRTARRSFQPVVTGIPISITTQVKI